VKLVPDLAHPERVPPGLPAALVYDFNPIGNAEFAKDPWAMLARVQREAPEIFLSTDADSEQGNWYVQSEAAIRELLQNNAVFTTEMGISPAGAPWPRKIIPLEVDPPLHRDYRKILSPLFSPRTIDQRNQQIRALINELIDGIEADEECEFLEAFAKPLPSTVLVDLMGLPEDRRAEFVEWVEQLFHGATLDERRGAGVKCMDYLSSVIDLRYANPENDAISFICQATADGKPLPREVVEDMVMFLFQAGLDTVTAGLAHCFAYLAQHSAKQQELIDDPSLIENAVEEILRAFSWIGVTRRARVDTELQGAPIRAGDWLTTIPYGAGRDQAVHQNPDLIDFHRADVPHFAFGAGVHRCAGSHLARKEMYLAVEIWLARIGRFGLKPGQSVEYAASSMFQPRALPLAWGSKLENRP
jgi:cytochrome P450